MPFERIFFSIIFFVWAALASILVYRTSRKIRKERGEKSTYTNLNYQYLSSREKSIVRKFIGNIFLILLLLIVVIFVVMVGRELIKLY